MAETILDRVSTWTPSTSPAHNSSPPESAPGTLYPPSSSPQNLHEPPRTANSPTWWHYYPYNRLKNTEFRTQRGHPLGSNSPSHCGSGRIRIVLVRERVEHQDSQGFLNAGWVFQCFLYVNLLSSKCSVHTRFYVEKLRVNLRFWRIAKAFSRSCLSFGLCFFLRAVAAAAVAVGAGSVWRCELGVLEGNVWRSGWVWARGPGKEGTGPEEEGPWGLLLLLLLFIDIGAYLKNYISEALKIWFCERRGIYLPLERVLEKRCKLSFEYSGKWC